MGSGRGSSGGGRASASGRRDFIMLLSGAAMSPLVAHAQTTAKTARIGVLQVARANPSTAPAYQAFSTS